VFPTTDNILSVEFMDSELWLVVSRADGTYLESIDCASGQSTRR
jgi:hypothetical protein